MNQLLGKKGNYFLEKRKKTQSSNCVDSKNNMRIYIKLLVQLATKCIQICAR